MAQGVGALPTVMHMAETTEHPWLRRALIDVTGRIRDLRAQPFLLRMLKSEDEDTQGEAIRALGRIGAAESVVPLCALLPGAAFRSTRQRLRLLEAIYRCGGVSAIDKVLEIENDDTNRWFYAADILYRHQPLRKALGFSEGYVGWEYELRDRSLFEGAAGEWYYENVLNEPSPWRSPENPEFSGPFQAAKQEAWHLLWDECRKGNQEHLILRAYPKDPVMAEEDEVRPITVIHGDRDVNFVAARLMDHGVVALHRFSIQYADRRSSECTCRYERGAVERPTFLALVAGMRTALEATVRPWWHGPERGGSAWGEPFQLVRIMGLSSSDATPLVYYGYPGSHTRPRYLRLGIAALWMEQFLASHGDLTETSPDETARLVFSDIYRQEIPKWQGWHVGQPVSSMKALAKQFGDESLRESLDSEEAKDQPPHRQR